MFIYPHIRFPNRYIRAYHGRWQLCVMSVVVEQHLLASDCCRYYSLQNLLSLDVGLHTLRFLLHSGASKLEAHDCLEHWKVFHFITPLVTTLGILWEFQEWIFTSKYGDHWRESKINTPSWSTLSFFLKTRLFKNKNQHWIPSSLADSNSDPHCAFLGKWIQCMEISSS